MKFRSTANHAVLEISNHDRSVVRAFFRVTLDEAVVHEAVEAVMTARMIEPQQMIAQQRQLLLLAQGPNLGCGERRADEFLVAQILAPPG